MPCGALDGVERPVWRNGEQVGTVQQYDNRLLQFLLRSHRPEICGDRRTAGPPPLPFDLAKRLAAGQRRVDAYQSRRRAGGYSQRAGHALSGGAGRLELQDSGGKSGLTGRFL